MNFFDVLLSAERSSHVNVHACINVLSIETSSCLNVETKPGTKRCGDGETEPTEICIWEMEYWCWPL